MGIRYIVKLSGSKLAIKSTKRTDGFTLGSLRAAKAKAKEFVRCYAKHNNIYALRIVSSWTRSQVLAGRAAINVY